MFELMAVLMAIGMAFATLAWFATEGGKWALKALKRFFVSASILGVLACIPDLDDLWKVRIALVKLELASPENIKSGIETIERIGKKLECKYLGCEDKGK